MSRNSCQYLPRLLGAGLCWLTTAAVAGPGGIHYPGEVVVDPRAVHTVSLRTNARITDMDGLYPGRRVTRGDTLFRFESAELITLQKSYLTTHRNMDSVSEITPRVKENVAQNRLSLTWRGMSEADIEHIEQTSEPLERIAVKSPVSGVITRVDVRVGQVVNAGVQSGQFAAVGLPVARIAEDDALFVEALVPPDEAIHFRAGMPVSIERSTGGPVDGQVEEVLPLVGNAVLRQRVLVRPVDKSRLHPGMRVMVSLPGEDAAAGAFPRGDGLGGHGHE